jgi:hypothetical protein
MRAGLFRPNLNQKSPTQEHQQPKLPNQPPQVRDTCISILNKNYVTQNSKPTLMLKNINITTTTASHTCTNEHTQITAGEKKQ